MKRILRSVLLFCMIAAAINAGGLATANADELPFMEVVPKDGYTFGVLTPESCPSGHLMPYPIGLYLDGHYERYVASFSLPEQAEVIEFSTTQIKAYASDGELGLIYHIRNDETFSELLYSVDKSCVIEYDSDRVAAVIEPDLDIADALISLTPQIGDGYLLKVQLQNRELPGSMDLQTRKQILSQNMTEELDRLMEDLQITKGGDFWSDGKYQGFILRDTVLDDEIACCFTSLPALELTDDSGRASTKEMTITAFGAGKAKGFIDFGDGQYVKMEMGLGSTCMAFMKLEDNPEDTETVTLMDGNEYVVYNNSLDSDKVDWLYVGRLVQSDLGYSGKQNMYLSMQFNCNNLYWTDLDDFYADLNRIVQRIKWLPGEEEDISIVEGISIPAFEDVFVPAETIPTVTMAPIPASAPTWTCPECGTENTGNFCFECGQPKPTPEPVTEENRAWVCPNCGTENSGNFCSECGTQKPVSDVWICQSCGTENNGNFCSECGAARPAETGAPASATETPAIEDNATPVEPYDNPFPEEMNRFTTPLAGTIVDHQIAIDGFLSYTKPSDEHYVIYDTSGTASDRLAWDRYIGATNDLYVFYENGGRNVYAYAIACEYDRSQRTEWATGALFPNTTIPVAAVLWVESGEDDDVYQGLMDQASEASDYEATRKLIRNLDPGESAMWFNHRISCFREELEDGTTDRYWIVFHNTAA